MANLYFKQVFRRKHILELSFWFILLSFIYFMLDFLNMPYNQMASEYSIVLVKVNIGLNIVMSLIGSVMFVMTKINYQSTKNDLKLGSASFITILFGFLTFGCSSCVISFFLTIGINLTVIALPLAGLPYKLFALVALLISFVVFVKVIENNSCKLKL